MESRNQSRQYMVGEFIGGDHKVLAVLGGQGKSGQGVVYLVESKDAPRPFVLKTCQALDPQSRAKLIKEAKAWITLGFHQNIVPAYFVREIDFDLYVAAEFIPPDAEGRSTLGDYINDGPQSLSRICNWICHFCDGLSHALYMGLLAHRDVKPANLLIDPNGMLRITDFGLATLSATGGKSRAVIGTPLYMAPEQFISPESVDSLADVYAIGIVLYQLLTGGAYPYRLPQDPAEAFEDLARIHMNEPWIRISSPFSSVIERCLNKNPSKRLSINDLRREVHSVAEKAKITITQIPSRDETEKELYAKARSLAALGDGQAALRAIEEYTKRYPQYPWGWTEKGLILFHLNRVQDAIRATEESLRRDPANSHAWNNLGVGLMRNAQFLEAGTAFQEALENDPYNTGSMMQLAHILAERGETSAPTRLLLRALKLHPKKKTLLFNASNIAAQIAKNGGFEQARELLECLTENEPENDTNWFNLALNHQHSRRIVEAIKCYRTVVDLKPSDSTALIFLAKCLAENADFGEAIKMCDRCLQLGDERQKVLVLKAQFLNAQGHYSSATRLLDDELAAHPDADMLWFILATIHEANGALREAQSAVGTCRSILVKEKRFDTENYRMVDEFARRLKKIVSPFEQD